MYRLVGHYRPFSVITRSTSSDSGSMPAGTGCDHASLLASPARAGLRARLSSTASRSSARRSSSGRAGRCRLAHDRQRLLERRALVDEPRSEPCREPIERQQPEDQDRGTDGEQDGEDERDELDRPRRDAVGRRREVTEVGAKRGLAELVRVDPPGCPDRHPLDGGRGRLRLAAAQVVDGHAAELYASRSAREALRDQAAEDVVVAQLRQRAVLASGHLDRSKLAVRVEVRADLDAVGIDPVAVDDELDPRAHRVAEQVLLGREQRGPDDRLLTETRPAALVPGVPRDEAEGGSEDHGADHPADEEPARGHHESRTASCRSATHSRKRV